MKLLSGYIDAKNSISYIQYKSKNPSINLTGEVAFRKIRVADSKGEQLFDLPKIGIGTAKEVP